MKPYTVFWNASDAPDDVWQEATQISASSPDGAIKKARDALPAIKADLGARFFAVLKFQPKRMRKRLVETYELDVADAPDDEPAQGTLA